MPNLTIHILNEISIRIAKVNAVQWPGRTCPLDHLAPFQYLITPIRISISYIVSQQTYLKTLVLKNSECVFHSIVRQET